MARRCAPKPLRGSTSSHPRRFPGRLRPIATILPRLRALTGLPACASFWPPCPRLPRFTPCARAPTCCSRRPAPWAPVPRCCATKPCAASSLTQSCRHATLARRPTQCRPAARATTCERKLVPQLLLSCLFSPRLVLFPWQGARRPTPRPPSPSVSRRTFARCARRLGGTATPASASPPLFPSSRSTAACGACQATCGLFTLAFFLTLPCGCKSILPRTELRVWRRAAFPLSSPPLPL